MHLGDRAVLGTLTQTAAAAACQAVLDVLVAEPYGLRTSVLRAVLQHAPEESFLALAMRYVKREDYVRLGLLQPMRAEANMARVVDRLWACGTAQGMHPSKLGKGWAKAFVDAFPVCAPDASSPDEAARRAMTYCCFRGDDAHVWDMATVLLTDQSRDMLDQVGKANEDKDALLKFGMRLRWITGARTREWLLDNVDLRRWPWCDAPGDESDTPDQRRALEELWQWQLDHDLVTDMTILIIIDQRGCMTPQARFFIEHARLRFRLDPTDIFCLCYDACKDNEARLVHVLTNVAPWYAGANALAALRLSGGVAPLGARVLIAPLLTTPLQRAFFLEHGLPLFYQQPPAKTVEGTHT